MAIKTTSFKSRLKGGQFEPDLGGQFAPDRGGQLRPDWGGHIERIFHLVFRGLSFYDSRRWGWTYAVSNGGGYYNGTFVTVAGVVYNNATINYNFLDYWDVPADESVLNPPGAGSAATVNPNF